MKIEASCPTCLRNYLGPEYTNKEVSADELRLIEGVSNSERNYAIEEIRDGCGDRVEQFSVFNQWKKEENISDSFQYWEDSTPKLDPYTSTTMQ